MSAASSSKKIVSGESGESGERRGRRESGERREDRERRETEESRQSGESCWDSDAPEDIFMIVYYREGDIGSEYEIATKEDVDKASLDFLSKGAFIETKFGSAKCFGRIVSLSDNYEDLKSNFEKITAAHKKARQDRKLKKEIKQENNNDDHQESENKVAPDDLVRSPTVDHLRLKRKYESLQDEADRLDSMFSNVKRELEDTMRKLEYLQPSTSSGGGSSSRDSLSPFNRSSDASRHIDDNKENINIVDSLPSQIVLGAGGTSISRNVYNSIKWHSYTAATRTLLVTCFSREVLATHSLTGKPSPAFLDRDKETKMMLNPRIISDIVETVCNICGVSKSQVRNAITTKCADESKLHRKRVQKASTSKAESDV